MRDAAPDFSYALAAASLERQAAQSLKTHGAAPKNSSPAAASTAPPTDDARSSVPDSPTDAAAEKTAAATSASPPPRQESKAPPALSAPSPVAPTPPPTGAAAPSLLPAQTTQARSVDAVAARDAVLAAKSKAADVKTLRPQEPAALPADFARILAKRLEETSIFDIRLDPPDLGRVDGKLSINDDGKAVLALAFDNQSAFDLFSRDEQALRQALADAGLDFGVGDFVFSFRERAESDAAPREASVVDAMLSHEEPAPFASGRAGAVDIRI